MKSKAHNNKAHRRSATKKSPYYATWRVLVRRTEDVPRESFAVSLTSWRKRSEQLQRDLRLAPLTISLVRRGLNSQVPMIVAGAPNETGEAPSKNEHTPVDREEVVRKATL